MVTAMKRCRLKRYNFRIINKMSKENKTLDKQENGNDFIADVSSSKGCSYSITLRLRYAKIQIYFEQGVRYELRLQQMWQGSDGSEDWRWVEVVE
jgi:hypothetical protein